MRANLLTYLALMALLAITAVTANMKLGAWNTGISFAISVAKAALIAAVYMQLRAGGKTQRLFAAAGIIWLGILFNLALSDFLSRGALHIAGK